MEKITDKSNDKKYFIITPRIVHMMCDPYQLKVWTCIKDIAGENGYCELKTKDLAKLCRMSAGKLHQVRKELIEMGLILGEKIKNKGARNYTWQITIPDLWDKNIEWARKHKTIQERIHGMNSCDESVIGGTNSSGEVLKEELKENTISKRVYSFSFPLTNKQEKKLISLEGKYPKIFEEAKTAVERAPRPSYAYLIRVIENRINNIDWKKEYNKSQKMDKDYLGDKFAGFIEA